MIRRSLSAAGTAMLAAVLLTACTTPTAPDAAPSAPPAVTPTAPTEATPTDTPDADAGEPTCETIIPSTTAADFRSLGWTVQTEAFRVGATELSGGIQCKWGDSSVTSDRIQMFGWAPIEADAVQDAVDELVASGWKREDGSDGLIYVTEDPDWAIGKDADGYGITYLFGDDWVKIADTKQSLVLVEWPPAQR